MDNPRAEKVAVVDEVREHFGASDAVILTEYRGLKVKDLAGLRRSLRTGGGEYKIYKNTLVTLAARQSGLAGLEPLLEGPTAIAFVKGDAAAVAKTLRDYARTNPLLVIKGGVLGDKVIGAAETTALAELPSREVLLAQFAGALQAPMAQLAGLLQALPRNLAYGLSALRDKLEAGQPASPPAVDAAEDAPAATDGASLPADAAPAATDEAAPASDAAPAATDDAPAAPTDDAPAAPTDDAPAAPTDDVAGAEAEASTPDAAADEAATPEATEPTE
jgi:large subunit ribosomal protein L10